VNLKSALSAAVDYYRSRCLIPQINRLFYSIELQWLFLPWCIDYLRFFEFEIGDNEKSL
jgi:hypothetical protein